MQFPELDTQGMIRRSCRKRGDLLFQRGGFRFDDKDLGCGDGQHDNKNNAGNNGAAAFGKQQADERDHAAGQSPTEISREEDANNATGDIAGIGLEDDGGQDKGK